MTPPTVRYVLSVECDERLQALRGEAAVLAAADTVWQGKIPSSELEGHVTWAIMELARAAKDALDIMEATKPTAVPPPPEPKRRRKQGQTGKATEVPSVSRSRLR